MENESSVSRWLLTDEADGLKQFKCANGNGSSGRVDKGGSGPTSGSVADGPTGDPVRPPVAKTSTILLADGLATDQEFVRKVLGGERYQLLSAHDTQEVLNSLNSRLVDLVILSDHGAPSEGLECCRRIKTSRKTELIPVLMLTDDAVRSQIQALSAGADDVLCPPAHPELARTQIRALLRQKAATDRLEQAEAILFSLAQTVELRDKNTGGHCERLSLFSLLLGMALGLDDDDLLALHRGGYLHDIGKVGVPDGILNKPGPLDEKEWEAMQTHTVRGEEICRPLRSLEKVLPIIRSHHEKWDGSGYPDGLKGDEIPLLARVLQMSDIYDALTNERPYKEALTPEVALEMMQQETDRGWRDPGMMEVFRRLHSKKSKETWRDAEDMQQSLRNLQQHLMEA